MEISTGGQVALLSETSRQWWAVAARSMRAAAAAAPPGTGAFRLASEATSSSQAR
ncbi:MAG TPA: hypothetical protein VGC06_16810 [Actinomycetes bacterium]